MQVFKMQKHKYKKKNILQKMEENKIFLLKPQHLYFLLKTKRNKKAQQQNKTIPN